MTQQTLLQLKANRKMRGSKQYPHGSRTTANWVDFLQKVEVCVLTEVGRITHLGQPAGSPDDGCVAVFVGAFTMRVPASAQVLGVHESKRAVVGSAAVASNEGASL